MGFYKDLTPFDKDLLKELCTIGTGNAATSLSAILKTTISILVPSLDVILPEEMPENLGEPESSKVVIFSYLSGAFPAKFLIIFSEEESMKIAKTLISSKVDKIDFDSPEQEIFKSMLMEIGNIIISSYVNAMSMMINASLLQSPPQIKHDILESIIDEFCIESAEGSNELLLLKNKFLSHGNEILFDIIFIPDEISLKNIFAHIKGES